MTSEALRPVHKNEDSTDFWIHAQLKLWKRIAGLSWDRFPQSSLFAGSPGRGQKQIIKAWFQLKICEQPLSSNAPCDDCPNCRRVRHGNHPDLSFHSFEKIGEFREFLPQVHLHPLETPKRMVVLEDFQEVTPQSANSLLKTLEEPPSKTLFVLLTAQRSGVLRTIQSRCVEFLVPPLADQDLKYLLRLAGVSQEFEKRAPLLLNGGICSEERLGTWKAVFEKDSDELEFLEESLESSLAKTHEDIFASCSGDRQKLQQQLKLADTLIQHRLLLEKNVNRKLLAFSAETKVNEANKP